MPPEVMVANPKYDTSVDEFSYGIMMIHIFSGQWPEPQVGPNQIEDGKLIPVSEAERREKFLHGLMNDCPLVDLILLCIDNHPQVRAHASELVKRFGEMVQRYPFSHSSRLNMLRCIEANDKERANLKHEVEQMNKIIDKNEEQISSLKEEIQTKDHQMDEKVEELAKKLEEQENELKIIHGREKEELQQQNRDLKDQFQTLKDKNETELTDLRAKIERYESELESSVKILNQAREQFDEQLTKKIEQQKETLAKMREEYETQLAKERNEFQSSLADVRGQSEKLAAENSQLLSKVSRLTSENGNLEERNSTLVMSCANMVSRKNTAIAVKDSEIETMTRVLKEQDFIISEISQQLVRAKEYLTSKQQVSNKILVLRNL
jgi:chromosome segregation ATPase